MTENPAPYDYAPAITAVGEATKAIAEQAGNLGRYVAAVIGSAPHNLAGIYSDRFAHARARQAAKLYAGTKKILEEAGLNISQLSFPTASIEIPLLEAATIEDREILSELWERLLAAAIAPSTRSRVRVRHIEIVKSLEPLDAWILQNWDRLIEQINKDRTQLNVMEQQRRTMISNEGEIVNLVRTEIDADGDDIRIAIQALNRLDLLQQSDTGYWNKTITAKTLLRVIDKESLAS